jgi:hypothetical protein
MAQCVLERACDEPDYAPAHPPESLSLLRASARASTASTHRTRARANAERATTTNGHVPLSARDPHEEFYEDGLVVGGYGTLIASVYRCADRVCASQ